MHVPEPANGATADHDDPRAVLEPLVRTGTLEPPILPEGEDALHALPVVRDLDLYPEELDQLLAAREEILIATASLA